MKMTIEEKKASLREYQRTGVCPEWLNLIALAAALQAADNGAAIHKWSNDDPTCKRLFVNGQTVLDIDAGGFHVGVTLQDTGWKTRADIKITNHSTQPVDIHPEQFKATETEGPKTRELKYNDPDALIKSIRRQAGWRQFGAAMGGGATKTTTSQTTERGTVDLYGPGGTASGTYGGTSTTTTQPDYEARRRAAAQVEQIRVDANNAVATLQSTVLRVNTVLPSSEIYGAVFFDRQSKDATDCVVTVVVGTEVYQFPFHRPKE